MYLPSKPKLSPLLASSTGGLCLPRGALLTGLQLQLHFLNIFPCKNYLDLTLTFAILQSWSCGILTQPFPLPHQDGFRAVIVNVHLLNLLLISLKQPFQIFHSHHFCYQSLFCQFKNSFKSHQNQEMDGGYNNYRCDSLSRKGSCDGADTFFPYLGFPQGTWAFSHY